MIKRNILLGCLIMVGIIIFAACIPPPLIPDFSLKYSGGGVITSAANDDKRANFGFHYDGTTDPPTIRGTYHDKAAGINLKLSEVVFAISGEGDTNKCMLAEIMYEPMDHSLAGGKGGVLACDDVTEDEILIEDLQCETYPCDVFAISFDSGSYAGYMNAGEVLRGNLINLE